MNLISINKNINDITSSNKMLSKFKIFKSKNKINTDVVYKINIRGIFSLKRNRDLNIVSITKNEKEPSFIFRTKELI